MQVTYPCKYMGACLGAVGYKRDQRLQNPDKTCTATVCIVQYTGIYVNTAIKAGTNMYFTVSVCTQNCEKHTREEGERGRGERGRSGEGQKGRGGEGERGREERGERGRGGEVERWRGGEVEMGKRGEGKTGRGE